MWGADGAPEPERPISAMAREETVLHGCTVSEGHGQIEQKKAPPKRGSAHLPVLLELNRKTNTKTIKVKVWMFRFAFVRYSEGAGPGAQVGQPGSTIGTGWHFAIWVQSWLPANAGVVAANARATNVNARSDFIRISPLTIAYAFSRSDGWHSWRW